MKKITIYVDKDGNFNLAVLEVDKIQHVTSDVRQCGALDSIDVYTSTSTVLIGDFTNNININTAEELIKIGERSKIEFELEAVSYPDIITQTTFKGEELTQINFK